VGGRWPEGYRKMLLDYAENGLPELEENDQRFLREIIIKQVNDLADL
jgi:hypothetical protein